MQKKLKPPPYFARFCGQMFNDEGLIFKTLEERARAGVQVLAPQERRDFVQFLKEYLRGRFTDSEMLNLWELTEADVRFTSGPALRAFLTIAADIAEQWRPLR